MTTAKPLNVEQYISSFPAKTQKILNQVRTAVKKAAPKAEELISYGMPAYRLHGVLVYFAGYENHIGFYALPTGHAEFKKELSKYKSGKGSVQFPIDEPMPLKLITDIVKFRIAENIQKEEKKNKRSCPKGHIYFKSSDCPTCPHCENEKKPKNGFLSELPAPARRALENSSIKTLKQLAACSEKEILALHGMGKASLPKLRASLAAQGLRFKE